MFQIEFIGTIVRSAVPKTFDDGKTGVIFMASVTEKRRDPSTPGGKYMTQNVWCSFRDTAVTPYLNKGATVFVRGRLDVTAKRPKKKARDPKVVMRVNAGEVWLCDDMNAKNPFLRDMDADRRHHPTPGGSSRPYIPDDPYSAKTNPGPKPEISSPDPETIPPKTETVPDAPDSGQLPEAPYSRSGRVAMIEREAPAAGASPDHDPDPEPTEPRGSSVRRIFTSFRDLRRLNGRK